MFEARVQAEPFDMAHEHARISQIASDIGAVVSFTGQVRDHALTLEHWPGVAERRMTSLLADARSRWPLHGAILVHRFGPLDMGAPIVLVLTASSHRAPAFAAAAFLMDWLKTRAPFWKRTPDGWVDAKASDTIAAQQWNQPRDCG